MELFMEILLAPRDTSQAVICLKYDWSCGPRRLQEPHVIIYNQKIKGRNGHLKHTTHTHHVSSFKM